MMDSDLADSYRIFGAEMSPYSVKVRSYVRYKDIPHQWILRNGDSQAEFEKHARMPIIPLVVTPEGTGIQDSTPIIEQLEESFPEPSVHPVDGVARFLSALIEEFGDEWGNKWMFHYRWTARSTRSPPPAASRGCARPRPASSSTKPWCCRCASAWSSGSGTSDRTN